MIAGSSALRRLLGNRAVVIAAISAVLAAVVTAAAFLFTRPKPDLASVDIAVVGDSYSAGHLNRWCGRPCWRSERDGRWPTSLCRVPVSPPTAPAARRSPGRWTAPWPHGRIPS